MRLQNNIVTDWWMQASRDPDFEELTNDAYRVRTQVDVLIPGSMGFQGTDGDGSLLESFGKKTA